MTAIGSVCCIVAATFMFAVLFIGAVQERRETKKAAAFLRKSFCKHEWSSITASVGYWMNHCCLQDEGHTDPHQCATCGEVK